MELDPRRLLTLQAVSRHGGVAGAASALHITPSAVSQQLYGLERSAGVSLIDRSARAVRLTPAGVSLLGAAARIEDALDSAEAELGLRQGVVGGQVTLGSFQSAIITLVAPAVEALRERHPTLTVQVREVSDGMTVRQLRSGQLDVGTSEVRLGAALPRGFAEIPIIDDPWRVIVPASWPVSQVAQLGNRPWISTFDDARADALAELANEHRFSPFVAHRCIEYPSVIALVGAGAGAAVVPAIALQLFATPLVRRLRASGAGTRTITVLHRTSRKEPTPAVRAVIDALLTAASNAPQS